MENNKVHYKLTKLVTKAVRKTSGIKRVWPVTHSFKMVAQA